MLTRAHQNAIIQEYGKNQFPLTFLMKKYAKGNATEAQVKIPVVIDAPPEEEWIR